MDSNSVTAAVDEALQRLDQQPPSIRNDLPERLREDLIDHLLSENLVGVLEGQQEFRQPRLLNSLTGGFGFSSRFVAPMLFREARRRQSASSAVQWLQKVLATERATGIAVYTMWGITVDHEITLADDLRLLPFAALPASRQKDELNALSFETGLRRVSTPIFAWEPPTAALTLPVEVSPFFTSGGGEHPEWDRRGRTTRERFKSARLCLAMAGSAIVVPGPSWFQYLDPDVEAAAALVSGTHLMHQEVLPLHIASTIAIDVDKASALTRAFFSVEPSLKLRLETAMERAHQARLRRDPADGSLELAIALETLLVNTPGEHTFKIALRSALLTSDDLAVRATNRAIIEAAYGMRSALMHSGQAPDSFKVRGLGKLPSAEIVNRAAGITIAVIQRILLDGQFPDWPTVELSTGAR